MNHNESAWQAPPAHPRLGPEDAHLWLVALERLDGNDNDTLSTAERRRADRIQLAARRVQYITAQTMLRRVLAAYLGTAAASVAFARGANGKPYLDACHQSNLGFNLSHSGAWALIGVTLGREIGVDIEVHRRADWLALAQRFFAHGEARRLAALGPQRRQDGFFGLWTAKEALAKAMGTGIAGTLDRFEFELDDRQGNWRDRLDKIASEQWRVRRLPAPPGCSAALAIQQPLGELHYYRVP